MAQESLKSFSEKPTENQALISLMCRTFEQMARKRAITFVRSGHAETSLSFEQLDRDSDSMAYSFREMGIRKSDCVVLFLPKSVYWVVAHIGIQKTGAISVPLNPGFKMEEAEYFFQETEPSLAVVGTEQQHIVRQIDPDVAICCFDTGRPYESPANTAQTMNRTEAGEADLEEPALIVFTSGTTGRPKGAVLTQGNLSHDAQNIVSIWEIGPDDVFCHALPLFHVHGLCFGAHASLVAGATMVMLDSFDPHVVLDILSEKETTMFMAVPTMYSKLLERHPETKIDYSHLRLLTSGSAPLLEKDFERISQTFGKEPVEREGMTETLMNFSNPLHGTRKPGSIGLPLPHLQVRIVDPETFQDVRPGQIGEIWLKGPAITHGYWRNPGETERAFIDGWFRTGDMGRKDEDGYYYITDRIKNIIVSGGENVSPKEIEMVINAHDDVVESSVVGIPDKTWGEAVAAAVVVKPGSALAPDDIKSLCRKRLLNWKCPKIVLVVDELPKNRMGKVLRDKVRELFTR